MAEGSSKDDEGDSQIGERVLFAAYLLVIVAGLAYFIVIGLTHH
jgi:hypothetical protein